MCGIFFFCFVYGFKDLGFGYMVEIFIDCWFLVCFDYVEIDCVCYEIGMGYVVGLVVGGDVCFIGVYFFMKCVDFEVEVMCEES